MDRSGARPRVVVAALAGSHAHERAGRLALGLALALVAAGCGNYIEFEPRRPPPTDGDGRAFYERCADALARPPSVDDAGYAELLQRRVSQDGAGFAVVDYVAWADATVDVAALDDYVAALAGAEPARCDLAFWINAYNANVLRAVLEEFDGDTGYSVSQDDFAFFTAARHPVAGMMLTLDELEHGVVRGDWAHPSVAGAPELDALMVEHARLWEGTTVDARIHMALNCAARGCPNLGREPYDNRSLDAQLDAATAAFLGNPDKGAGPDGITQLFQWFAADFVADSGSVEGFIERQREGGLEGVDTGAFIDYDWSLNAR